VSSAAEHPLTWADFDEQPATEVELRSPAAELAVVLQRYRADLDEAARAGSEGRAQGLRALADQAVLAVELEGLLELQQSARDVSPERMHGALLSVKDRMLAHVASSGLEIVRLRGARGEDVVESVDVDQWRYDDGHTVEVVVEELEVAVRLDGVPLRRGRVVMGAPREVPATAPVSAESEPGPQRSDGEAGRARAMPERPLAPTIVCPVADCGTENHAAAEICVGCLTLLTGYGRLTMHPQVLFNQGLRAARGGDYATARECFAAVVLWQPHDLRTRNAYALACLDARDRRAARRAWEEVLARAPGDALAVRGMAALTRAERAGES
jgi:tetratricopeptide (TPR) repeat protein